MKGETQLSGRITFLIVGSMFLAVTVVTGALGVHLYKTNTAPTAMAGCIGFAWGFGSTIIAMILALLTSGRPPKGKVGVRVGKVSVGLGDGSPGSHAHIAGSGAEADGEAGIRITSTIPSVFLMASSACLALLVLFLLSRGRLDVIGGGVLVVFVGYIANWSRLAWPRKPSPVAGGRRR